MNYWKYLLKKVICFLGLLGFAAVLGGSFGAFAGNPDGITVALAGAVLVIFVFISNLICDRFLNRPWPLPLDKNWQKLKKLKN